MVRRRSARNPASSKKKCCHGKFKESIRIPGDIERDSIKSKMRDGFLVIQIDKVKA